SPGSAQRTWSFVSAAGAVVFIGAGVVAALVREDRVTAYNADHRCPGTAADTQPPPCDGYVSTSRAMNVVSWGGFIAGRALAAPSIGLVATLPSSPRSRVGCGAGPGLVGIACGARF